MLLIFLGKSLDVIREVIFCSKLYKCEGLED